MILKFKVGTISFTDKVSVCEELKEKFKDEINNIIDEEIRIIKERNPKRSRAVASLIAKTSSPEARERLYEDIANDESYLEFLGMKAIKRDNKKVIVPRNYVVFFVYEKEGIFDYNKAAVRR